MPNDDNLQSKAVTASQLRSFIQRIERLEEEAILDLYKQALGME